MKPSYRKKSSKAYNKAVYNELQRSGHSPDKALKLIHNYSRPLKQTWGLELNPEAFANEILKLQQMKTKPLGKTVTIKPHIRSRSGHELIVKAHKRSHPNTNVLSHYGPTIKDGTTNLLTNSKVKIKVDSSTGKVILGRNNT